MSFSELPQINPLPLRLTQSDRLLALAQKSVAGVTSSMMKRPEQFSPGHFPVYLRRGHGALVEDVDGNQYIDYVCGLGANSLGHGHPAVVSAVREALENGILHSLPVQAEVEATLSLVASVPNAEMARFFKTGADATSAAVRLARHLTKREAIVTVGYNGWHDHFMYDTPGVPSAVAALTTRMPLFTEPDEPKVLDLVRARGPELAAIVLSLPYGRLVNPAFLKDLRELCSSSGTLLVFDEIVTGFRLAPGGAQSFYGVAADLTCYSKALAAGLPLSALVGPKSRLEAMQDLQVSTTFGGETLSLAACLAALRVYQSTNYYEELERLGRLLRIRITDAAEDIGAPLRIHGYDCIPLFSFSPNPEVHMALMRVFQGHMAERGVLLRRDLNFICAAHTDAQIEHTAVAAHKSLALMKQDGAFK